MTAKMVDATDAMVPPIRWKTSIPLRHVARSTKAAAEDDEESPKRRSRVQSLHQELALLRIRNKFDRRLQDLRILSLPKISTTSTSTSTSTSVGKSDLILPTSSLLMPRDPTRRAFTSVESRILATRRLLWPRHSSLCWRRGYCSCSQDSSPDSQGCRRCGFCAGLGLPLDAEPLQDCCCKWSFPRSDFARRLWLGLPRQEMTFPDPDELVEERRWKRLSLKYQDEGVKEQLAERAGGDSRNRGGGKRRDSISRPSTSSRSDSRYMFSQRMRNTEDDSDDDHRWRSSARDRKTGDSQTRDIFHHGNSLRSVFNSHPDQVPSVRKYSNLLQQSLQDARDEIEAEIEETAEVSDEDPPAQDIVSRRPTSGIQPVSLAVMKLRALLCKANTITSKYQPVHSTEKPSKSPQPGPSFKSRREDVAKTGSAGDNAMRATEGDSEEGEKEDSHDDDKDLDTEEELSKDKTEAQQLQTKAMTDGNRASEEMTKSSGKPLVLRSSLKPRTTARFTQSSNRSTAKGKSVTFASDIHTPSTSRMSSPRHSLPHSRDMDSDFRVALLDLAVRRRIQRQLQDQERGVTDFRLPVNPRVPSDPMALLRQSQATHLQRLGTGNTYLQRLRRSEPLSLRTAMTRAAAKCRKF